MNRLCLIALAISFAMLSGPSVAATIESGAPFVCSSNEIFECDRGTDCQRTTLDAVDAPAWLLVDTEKNEIRPLPQREENPTSMIERMESVDNKIILQGAEDGREGVRDGLGWTLAVAEDTGRMVLTASGEDVGFVIFGRCMVLPK